MNRVLLLLTVLSFGLSAYAETEVRIGTVDMQKALRTVKAGMSARSKLEAEFNKKKGELQKEEQAIKKMHDDFQKQSLVMSADARGKKQAEIQKRVMELQEKTMRSQQEIQGKEASLTKPIIDGLRDIISDLAQKKKYTVVLEKNENTVLYSMSKDDLTDEVISAFNKKN